MLRCLLDAGTLEQRAHPGGELGQMERLVDVVIAAGAEAREAIGHGITSCQEQHRSLHAPGTQRLA